VLLYLSLDFDYAKIASSPLLVNSNTAHIVEGATSQLFFDISARPTLIHLDIIRVDGSIMPNNINVNNTMLNINQAVRQNTGIYNITLSNSVGGVYIIVNINVICKLYISFTCTICL